jgi:chromate transporter
VVLNLTIYLGKAVIFPTTFSLATMDYLVLSWVVVSFFAMYRFKVGMMKWIGVSAFFGLFEHFIFH